MQRIIGTISFLILSITVSFSQSNTKYNARLKKMFEMSGSMETYHAAVNQMFAALRIDSGGPAVGNESC